jgi:hypothetical protein
MLRRESDGTGIVIPGEHAIVVRTTAAMRILFADGLRFFDM